MAGCVGYSNNSTGMCLKETYRSLLIVWIRTNRKKRDDSNNAKPVQEKELAGVPRDLVSLIVLPSLASSLTPPPFEIEVGDGSIGATPSSTPSTPLMTTSPLK